jgi:adenylosuccinate lyase
MTLEYASSFSTRYSSSFMRALFSEKERASLFRDLWIKLAEIEKELGLDISEAAILEMKKHLYSIDLEKIKDYEKLTHHDVMAHILAYADLCPKASGIIHLGATSCYVTDNADIMIYHKALKYLLGHFKKLILELCTLADKYKNTMCVGYTHFQVAQATTMGKRFCLWIQDLYHLYQKLEHFFHHMKALGIKGATGTQSSFYALFDQDEKKVLMLDQLFSEKTGLKVFEVSGQTYTRLQDSELIHIFAEIGAVFHKMGTDLRLLAHTGEMHEGFEKGQVGSSAMPHKKNPILSERLCSLSRFLMQQSVGSLQTYANQWLERSLDDSAIRRLIMPESFLCLDACLDIALKLTKKLQVDEIKAKEILESSLRDLSQEALLMHLVLKGHNRQKTHELLKEHGHKGPKDLDEYLHSLQKEHNLHIDKEFIQNIKSLGIFTAMCPIQVDHLLKDIQVSI